MINHLTLDGLPEVLGHVVVDVEVDRYAHQFGYRYLAIEPANANASAFAERLGFSPRDNGRHWIGTVDDVQKALNS
ncbi:MULTISPECIES: hypothetical protein [unclassified Pseudomonas]|uniref:hypothetical protein n=1 Tax=unclassified Pseudomonas TaxID=196821 RepID=UPI000BD9FB1B|nr:MULTISPECIES: hypothetical protein [unclassified Pseudomonas]PXX72603.1 hypothetical protein D906_00590 [Pseudomonas sp. LAIL14HWK12:I1]SOC95645.1 hypothetical protein SAMN05660198_00594 [Pseudomonas sp. LAIL14HWK12:I3]